MTDPTKLSNEALADALEKDCSYDLDNPIPHLREAARRLRSLSPRPIEEAPDDGREVILLMPGGVCIAPAPRKMSRDELRAVHLEIHKATGEWPSVQWVPTHFIDLSALEVPSDETECGCRLETGEVFNIGDRWNTRALKEDKPDA